MGNVRLLVAAALTVLLSGCGQKGPLLLPDAQHPHKKIGVRKPPAPPAPSSPAPSSPAPSSPAPLPSGAGPASSGPQRP